MPISEVFCEDNMLGMARYPDKFFDLAVVDPPYGIGMDNQKKRVKPNRPNSYTNYADIKYKISEWDTKIPDHDYFKELFRVSENQIIWGANYFCSFIPNGKGWIYWDKQMGDNNFSMGEFAYQSMQIKSSSFSFPSDRSKNRIHPTEKPIYLYNWCLNRFCICKNCLNEGGYYEDIVGDGGSRMYIECENCDIPERGMPKILDTHMGSQSSRIAAFNMGFDYYGWEIDKDYFEAGNKRFKEQTMQQQLFK